MQLSWNTPAEWLFECLHTRRPNSRPFLWLFWKRPNWKMVTGDCCGTKKTRAVPGLFQNTAVGNGGLLRRVSTWHKELAPEKKDSVCPHLNFYNSQHNFWNFCLECAGRFQSNRLRFYSLRQLYRLRLVTNHLAFLSTFNSSTSWDRQYSNSTEIIINFLLTYFLNFYF